MGFLAFLVWRPLIPSVSLRLKKGVKFALDTIHRPAMGLARIAGLIRFPVPPWSAMGRTSSKTVWHYYESGVNCSLPIMTACQAFGVPLEAGTKMLDFGCGVGRQLLHFTRHFPQLEFYACDVDETCIDFIQKHYKNVDAHTSRFTPPLKYDDAFFDAVYSVSIFSHLCFEDHQVWLAELARVTRPGGLCLLTTEGPTASRCLTRAFKCSESELLQRLNSAGYLFTPYPDFEQRIEDVEFLRQQSNLGGIDRPYGNTIFSPEYIRQHWPGHGFEVVAICEGIIDYRQDLVVLRRRA